MKSPTVRYAVRCILVGVAAAASSLQASAYGSDLTQGEVVTALLSGITLALGYAGIGYGTSVEPKVGRGKLTVK